MKKYFIYSILLGMILSSCKKDHSTLLTAQDFPTTVGSWWKYLRLKSDNSIFDTTTYTILDSQVINGVVHQRWVETQTGLNAPYPDTTSVEVSATGVMFNAELNIQFPIIDNETWCTPEQGYTYKTNIQNITVNGTQYNNAAYLNKYTNFGMGTTVNESYWIVKNIGFVEQLINDGRGPYLHLTLVSYHIN